MRTAQQAAAAGAPAAQSPEAAADEQQLFHTPPDLVCPITLSLLVDPVCTAAGQVYERASIQRHLLQAAVSGQPPTDPISNAPLASLDLVPVWPMRSRATEYRERTIRTCVTRAAAPACADPVRYLRRAAELLLSADAASAAAGTVGSGVSNCGDVPGAAAGAQCTHDAPPPPQQPQQQQLGSAAAAAAPPGPAAAAAAAPAAAAQQQAGVPGLSRDFAQYLMQASSQGALHETLALKFFGNELVRAGCPDAASTVFYRLLLAADDTAQQAEFLQLCLDCWGACGGSDDSEAAAADGGSGGAVGGASDVLPHTVKASAAAAPAPAGGTSPAILAKLADFVQRQRCLSPRAIVRMLESTHHGAEMALQLCQVLLERAAAAAAAEAGAAPPAGSTVEGAQLGLPGGLGAVLELLLELQALVQGQLARQQQQLVQQVQQLQAQQQVCLGEGNAGAPAGPDEDEEAEAAARNRQPDRDGSVSGTAAAAASRAHGKGGGHRRRAWRGGKDAGVLLGRLVRAAAVATLSAASLAGGNHPALRVARVGPLLLLLRTGL